MTVYNIDTTDALKEALRSKSYSAGDEIVIAPGTYDISDGSGAKEYKVYGSGFTIRGKDPANPPLITRKSNTSKWTHGLLVLAKAVTIRDLHINGCREVAIRLGHRRDFPDNPADGAHIHDVQFSECGTGVYFEAEDCRVENVLVRDGVTAVGDSGGGDADFAANGFVFRAYKSTVRNFTGVNLFAMTGNYGPDGDPMMINGFAPKGKTREILIENVTLVRTNTVLESGSGGDNPTYVTEGVTLRNYVVINPVHFLDAQGKPMTEPSGKVRRPEWVTVHRYKYGGAKFTLAKADITLKNGIHVNTLKHFAGNKPGALAYWLNTGEFKLDNLIWHDIEGDRVLRLGPDGSFVPAEAGAWKYSVLDPIADMTDSVAIIRRLEDLGIHAARQGNPYSVLSGETPPVVVPPTPEPPTPEPPTPEPPTPPTGTGTTEVRIKMVSDDVMTVENGQVKVSDGWSVEGAQGVAIADGQIVLTVATGISLTAEQQQVLDLFAGLDSARKQAFLTLLA